MPLLLNLFFVVVFIQIIFYLFVFRLPKNKNIKSKQTTEPVSIIIAARNEADNLNLFLPKIFDQAYPNFEVIVVNDGSADGTAEILDNFSKSHLNLTVLTVDNHLATGNKKNALTQAINSAKYEHLIFTDADCYPASKNWILKMCNVFSENKKIVLGYGAYQKIKGSWLNKLVRFETLQTAMLYFSHASIGLPYMGVGRNLAYSKQLFSKNKGFSNYKNLKSGDDDLFINDVANKDNVEVCIMQDAFTYSKPKLSLNSWLNQKRRHITTAYNYRPIHKISLATFHSSQLLFYVLLIFLIFCRQNLLVISGLIIVRFLVQYVAVYQYSKSLNEKDLLKSLPFWDFALVALQLYIFIHNLIKKPAHWS